MAKKQKQPTKTCADCIHESACRIWTDGRFISDASANECPVHETVKESAAYLCGVLDERKRKQTNADRIRKMSDDELAEFLFRFEYGKGELGAPWDCQGEALQWLRETAEQDDDEDERLPRSGRRILIGVGGTAGPVCSVCQDPMSWFLSRTTRYCFNCGAKMDGGDENGEG